MISLDEARRLTGLAWPIVLGQLGLVAMGVVDLMVVGSLGELPMAAVGLGNTWSFAGLIIGLGAASGLDPFITQAYGRDRPREAGAAALHGAGLLLCIAALLLVQHLLTVPALTLLQQPAEAIPGANLYVLINILGILPFLAFALVRQLLQGGGVMRPAMWVVWLANLVNAAADIGLVWYLDLGIAGAASATVIVRWVMFFAIVYVGRDVLVEAWPGRTWSWELFGRIRRKALPVGMQVGFEVWAFNAATLLAGILGTTAVAAHTAALSAASVAFMVPMGISGAAATRVGNQVGAGRPWRPGAWTAIAMGSGVMIFSGLGFYFLPHTIARVFTTDPVVVASIGSVLPIAAAFGLFDGVQVVAMGVLRGLGDTRGPAAIALFAYWGVGLPWGAWASQQRGLPGVWEGLALGLAVASVLLVFRVARPSLEPT